MEFRRGASNHGYCVLSQVTSQIDVGLLGQEGILKGLKRCVAESQGRVFHLSIYDVVCVADAGNSDEKLSGWPSIFPQTITEYNRLLLSKSPLKFATARAR